MCHIVFSSRKWSFVLKKSSKKVISSILSDIPAGSKDVAEVFGGADQRGQSEPEHGGVLSVKHQSAARDINEQR